MAMNQGRAELVRGRGASKGNKRDHLRCRQTGKTDDVGSRAGCHFAAAIGLRSLLEDFVPEIPDWVSDQHTIAERKLGRGLDHFRKEGVKLVPPPTVADPYEDEAYRLWALKQQGK
jgi:hypothetical protein